MNLLTVSNAKTVKGEKKGYLTGILYLKPEKSGGYKNVCPKATKGCTSLCLNTAGRGRFDRIQNGRQRKTDLLFNNPKEFYETLRDDIRQLKVRAKNKGLIPCVRLNGTSDLPSVARKMAKEYPDVIFYDYTKLPKPYTRTLPNYYLTFSRAENNWADCIDALENGINVSVVFYDKKPKIYKGYRVIDGDKTDLRFLDNKYKKTKKGLIVALRAKGKARKFLSDFVVIHKDDKKVAKLLQGGKIK